MKFQSLPNEVGTPKTIDEAIVHALCMGSLCEVRERAFAVLKDFMAQKFAVTYLELSHDPAALAAVEKLFENLTKRPAENSGLKSV